MYFPHPLLSDEDGLLAIGGDLSVERLLLAYSYGIFPWFDQPPILWWFTHPRSVIQTNEIKLSKSLKSLVFNKRPWKVTLDKDFHSVIDSCSSNPRKGQNTTWITEEIKRAYTELHELGYAHSVEVWDNDNLIGGLYGVLKGQIFYGESMFTIVSNASKYAFMHLCQFLSHNGIQIIDCQQDTQHMRSLGSVLLKKEDFWIIIRSNILKKTPNIDSESFNKWLQEAF